ncbi:hypothetical protein RHMOL_Rhmol08G0053700 [Rhododendron molle]|uniref:Uncharacterized protein n=1 Tax=Rhododendron molle TaxID=49168 RepID=A0ACC0MLG3_RHOML|nr:hypothetical protein RHMOL_Rhmol08G0053700 [Rhododendron molle]
MSINSFFMQRALAGLRRINLEGLRWRVFDAKGQVLGRYVGHLKERSLKDQMAKDPTEVIRKAVMRMLPRNKLRDDRDRKLRIFAGGEHPFSDRPLEPYVMPPRQVRELRPRVRRAMIRAEKKAELQKQGGMDTRKGRKKEEEKAELIEA